MAQGKFRKESRTGSVLAGLFLLIIGVFAIIQQSVSDFPSWILSWPMLLIAIGVFIGLKHGFRGPGWIILIGLGSIFLVDRIVPGVNLKPYIWPFVIMAVGLFMIIGGGKRKRWARREWSSCTTDFSTRKTQDASSIEKIQPVDYNSAGFEDEYIDSTSILGSAKKVIFSKNFKGGDITNFMGGAEINCSQADINGTVKLDITQIFGGTKLIIPPHWTVKSTATSIFAGFEDKRPVTAVQPDPTKVLVIDGTSIFGGIDIKSY